VTAQRLRPHPAGLSSSRRLPTDPVGWVIGGKLYEFKALLSARRRRRRASHAESTRFTARHNLKFP